MDQRDDLLTLLGTEIPSAYPLGAMRPLRYLENTHQRRHKKIVVESEKGKYLAKTYTNDAVTLDSLYFQHNLSNFLYSHDLPVAQILRTHAGKSFIARDNWAVELQAFLSGGPMPLTMHTLKVAGSCLGKFHSVCRGLPSPPRDARKWRFSEVPRAIFQDFYQRVLQERNDARMHGFCDTIVAFLGEATEELAQEKRDTFETGIIHGDWHGGNLLFVNEEIQGIIDLEYAGDGCYLEDLSYGLSNLCLRASVDAQKLENRTDIYLAAYEQHRSLSWGERVALFYAAGIKHITTVAFQHPTADGKVAGATPAQWLATLAEQTKWLARQAHNARWGN